VVKALNTIFGGVLAKDKPMDAFLCGGFQYASGIRSIRTTPVACRSIPSRPLRRDNRVGAIPDGVVAHGAPQVVPLFEHAHVADDATLPMVLRRGRAPRNAGRCRSIWPETARIDGHADVVLMPTRWSSAVRGVATNGEWVDLPML
jgi:hypothetical protein